MPGMEILVRRQPQKRLISRRRPLHPHPRQIIPRTYQRRTAAMLQSPITIAHRHHQKQVARYRCPLRSWFEQGNLLRTNGLQIGHQPVKIHIGTPRHHHLVAAPPNLETRHPKTPHLHRMVNQRIIIPCPKTPERIQRRILSMVGIHPHIRNGQHIGRHAPRRSRSHTCRRTSCSSRLHSCRGTLRRSSPHASRHERLRRNPHTGRRAPLRGSLHTGRRAPLHSSLCTGPRVFRHGGSHGCCHMPRSSTSLRPRLPDCRGPFPDSRGGNLFRLPCRLARRLALCFLAAAAGLHTWQCGRQLPVRIIRPGGRQNIHGTWPVFLAPHRQKHTAAIEKTMRRIQMRRPDRQIPRVHLIAHK